MIINLSQMLLSPVVFFLAFTTLSAACNVGTSPSGFACPAQCTNCHDNLTCTSCCYSYYVSTTGACLRCHDLHCSRCTLIGPSSTTCTNCHWNYALTGSFPNTCTICSKTRASVCSSVNNCNSIGNCLSCGYTYAVVNNTCAYCDEIYANCRLCNSTHCNTCNSPWYVNTTTYKECVQCSAIPECLTCINGPKCISCNTGFYVDADGFCQPCREPCLQCTSATNCTVCSTVGNVAIYNYNYSCLLCSQYVHTENCTTCQRVGTVYQCYSCLQRFYVSGNQCMDCLSPCLTCSDAITCLSCNSSYYLSGSNCQLCSTAISNCSTCSNTTTCLTCNSGFHLDTSSSPPSTVACISCVDTFPCCQTCNSSHCLSCLPGYTMDANMLVCQVFDCSSPCLTCLYGSPSFCSTCVSGYFLDPSTNSSCLQCGNNCLACSSLTICTTCHPDYFNNLGLCQPCPLGQYYNPHQHQCLSCPSFCLTCDLSDCLSCHELFELSTVNSQTLCVDICGDGIAVTNQCDYDSTADDGMVDGCSQNCEVQSNFNCSYSPGSYTVSNGSVVGVNSSECHYVGSVDVGLSESRQHMFSNTIELAYQIQPYLRGMPVSSDNQTYLLQVFSLNSTLPLSSYSISVDQQTGQVTFTVPYTQDLSPHTFTLQINYDLLSLANPTMLYLSNTTHTVAVTSLKQNGCFGEYSTEEELANCKGVHYASTVLGIVGLLMCLMGAFTKELAGLQQVVLFQTIFALLLFHQGKTTLAVLALGGFQLSLGIKLPPSGLSGTANTSNYLLETSEYTLTHYYIFNFLLYFIPLVALFFLIYKLKYKSFPFKMERGRHAEDCFRGEVLLYISLFNLFPLAVYTKAFIGTAESNIFYWDYVLAVASVLLTLAGFFNYVFRPQIVGIFRSAFRSFGGNRQQQSNSQQSCFKSCLTRRLFDSSFGEYYTKYAPSFYYIFISYMLVSVLLIVLAVSIKMILLTAIQATIMLLLIAAKPYFNKYEKIRAIFTFSLMILANFMTVELGGQFTIPLLLITGCGLHVILVGFVLVDSLVDQIRRKCNDRSQVVKRMFRVEEQIKASSIQEKENIQSKVMTEMIQRFNMSEQLRQNPLLRMNSQVDNTLTSIKKVGKAQESQDKNNSKAELDLHESDRDLKEEVIIEEEHEYIRYQRGLAFFNKYGKQLQKDLVKEYYDQI